MKPSIIFILFLFLLNKAHAQELFVYSEPASNMAAKSLGLRLNNYFNKKPASGVYTYQLAPELMWGISKKLMLHADFFFSNRSGKFLNEGGALYFKYRFLSNDKIHNHFRMAAYARAAVNSGKIDQPAIDLMGQNSGYEAGLIATMLEGRTAISATVGWLHAEDNLDQKKFIYGTSNRNAAGYSLSVGHLVFPLQYKNYDQVNMNLMLELPGQTNLGSGRSFLGAAPSVQCILLSRMRMDIGYRFPLVNDLPRAADRGFLLRLEYNFFNVYR